MRNLYITVVAALSLLLVGCAFANLAQSSKSQALGVNSSPHSESSNASTDVAPTKYDKLVEYAVEKAIPDRMPPKLKSKPTEEASTTPQTDRIQYYGQVGDFFGGFWGTILGAITTFAVLITWNSTKRIDARSKVYQVFAEILRTHEEIVSSWRIGSLSGRDALSVVLSEFYEGYEELIAMEAEGHPKLTLHERIHAAFLLTYYGSHPETGKTLRLAIPNLDGSKLCNRISTKKKSNKKKELEKKLKWISRGDKVERGEWHASIKESFKIVDAALEHGAEKYKVQRVLATAQSRPYHKFSVQEMHGLIEDYSNAAEFGGHQTRLSQYFRNLYAAFVFIDKQKLTNKEKKSLAKVLRSKLSNYEQALLALNSLTAQGAAWRSSGILRRYTPIKNIPQHFFSFDSGFDLAKEFEFIEFEWQKLGGKVEILEWIKCKLRTISKISITFN